MPNNPTCIKPTKYKKKLWVKVNRCSPKVIKRIEETKNPSPLDNSNDSIDNQNSLLPIPKGDSAYALAKYAEYKERDIEKAEKLYRKAIEEHDRKASAIKDLASLLHQKNQTKEACELLESNRELFLTSIESYENLLSTLQKQIKSGGNSMNKILKISGLEPWQTSDDIKNLFKNPVRVQSIVFDNEKFQGEINYYCIVTFNSHSSARKTLEGFCGWKDCRVEWVSISGDVICDAHYAKQRINQYRYHNPTFEYRIFDREQIEYLYTMPIDCAEGMICTAEFSEVVKCADRLLGKDFCLEIF